MDWLNAWIMGGLSLYLNWLLRLLRLAENRAPIYENIRVLLCIFLAIVLPLQLLHLAENRSPHPSTNEVDQGLEAGEEEQPNGDLDNSSEDGEQLADRTATASGTFGRHGACTFCGNLGTRRCSRCKAARYCSEECQVWHWRSGHKYECVETDSAGPVLGASKFVKKPLKESNEDECDSDKREVEYSNYREKRQPIDGTCLHVSTCNGCAVCGAPGTTSCSRCKAINYCSAKCLIEDWRWHKAKCTAVEENSTQAAAHAHENVGLLENSYEDEDNVHSSGSLCLEYYPEGSNGSHPLIDSSKEANKNTQEYTVEWVRCLEEEVEKSRNEIINLQSERDKWITQANFARRRFHSFKKESEHQLSVLNNEKKLISNAEEQARNVIHSLSERLHHLQMEVHTSIAEKKKQEEYIQMLETEYAQSKRELQKEQERIQQLNRNFLRDVTTAESRAFVAEVCAICLTNEKDLAFGCGHMTCRDCGLKMSKCPICREQITSHVRLYPG